MFYPIAAFGLFVAMKKSFILHIDSLAILDEMTFEQKGILFDAIYKHQLGEEVSLDFSMKMAFAPFKNQFIRDNEKYSEFIDKQKDNGSKGGRPKKPTQPNETQKTQAFSENPTEPKKAYNDSVSDNVNKSKSIEERLAAFQEQLNPFIEQYGSPMIKEFYFYWTEASQTSKKMRFEKEAVFDIKRRLLRWSNNNFNSNKKPQTDEQPRIQTANKAAIAAKYGKPNTTS